MSALVFDLEWSRETHQGEVFQREVARTGQEEPHLLGGVRTETNAKAFSVNAKSQTFC